MPDAVANEPCASYAGLMLTVYIYAVISNDSTGFLVLSLRISRIGSMFLQVGLYRQKDGGVRLQLWDGRVAA